MRSGEDNAVAQRGEAPDEKVEANERLTALTGIVLLVMFVIEIVTVVLSPRRVLTLHVVTGLILAPVVALKLVSTMWRMVNYYRGVEIYRRKGLPSTLLRVLGPVLSVLTILVVTSGVVLIVGPHRAYGAALFVHKKILYFWLTALVLHVIAHVTDAVRATLRDIGRRPRGSVPGGGVRLGVVSACVLLGTAVGLLLAGQGVQYLHSHPLRQLSSRGKHRRRRRRDRWCNRHKVSNLQTGLLVQEIRADKWTASLARPRRFGSLAAALPLTDKPRY